MAGAQMTRREALAMVAAALGMTMIAGCSPEWLDATSELTKRDLEVARNIGKTESDIASMRKRGRASDDVRGAEAAEDYLAERYGEQFKAVGTETEYDSAVSPSRVVVTLAVVSGPAAGAECRAVYRLEDGPSWSDDYVSVRLDAQLRAIATEAFSEGFGDLSKGEAVWQSEVSRTLFYADAADGHAIDPDVSLEDPGEYFAPKFVVFASPTTSLTEEGLTERLERAARVFKRARVVVFLHAYRVTAPVGDEGFTYEWADSVTYDGENVDWACHLSTEAGSED